MLNAITAGQLRKCADSPDLLKEFNISKITFLKDVAELPALDVGFDRLYVVIGRLP